MTISVPGQATIAYTPGAATISGSVCRIEQGQHVPRLDTVAALARALGCEANDLLIFNDSLQAHFEAHKAS